MAKPAGSGPRLAAIGANRPSGTRLTTKVAPFHGSSRSFAPVAAISATRPSPAAVTVTAPKFGSPKLPASPPSGGAGIGLAGRVKVAASSADPALACSSAFAA